MQRFGLQWTRTIGGWVAILGDRRYVARPYERGWWKWQVLVGPLTGTVSHQYSGRTLQELSAQIVADTCPFDYEDHTPECVQGEVTR